MTSAEMTVECRKRVSGSPVLRAAHRQPDGMAAELAIHIVEVKPEPLNQSWSSYTDIES
jgi:hypothetical protein